MRIIRILEAIHLFLLSLAVSVSICWSFAKTETNSEGESERREREERTEVWQAVLLFSISLPVCLLSHCPSPCSLPLVLIKILDNIHIGLWTK